MSDARPVLDEDMLKVLPMEQFLRIAAVVRAVIRFNDDGVPYDYTADLGAVRDALTPDDVEAVQGE